MRCQPSSIFRCNNGMTCVVPNISFPALVDVIDALLSGYGRSLQEATGDWPRELRMKAAYHSAMPVVY